MVGDGLPFYSGILGVCWRCMLVFGGRDYSLGKVELGLYIHFEVSMVVMVEVQMRFDAAKRRPKTGVMSKRLVNNVERKV